MELCRSLGLKGGSREGTGGGRVFSTPTARTPSVGSRFAIQNAQRTHRYNDHDQRPAAVMSMMGPTLGVRFRQRQLPGLGDFLQAEFVLHSQEGRRYVYPALGDGMQWWF